MEPSGGWEWSDAWLLTSIVLADRQPPDPGISGLADVLAWGDALNHAIFTQAELQAGLSRLRAVGLVQPDSYRPTPRGTALEELANRDLEPLPAIARLHELLAATELPDELPRTRVPKREIRAAYRAYNADFQRRLQQLEDDD